MVEDFFNRAGFVHGLVMVGVLLVLIDAIALWRVSGKGAASLKALFLAFTGTLTSLVCLGLFLVTYNVVLSRGYLGLGSHGEEDSASAL